MSEKPVKHGYDHRAGGLDPILPGYWHYVHSSTGLPTAWSGSTHYVPGNIATQGVYTYTCMQANTNVQPGTTNWAVYWIIDQPIFQNGWANTGTGLQAMRYRISVGRPHLLDYNDGSITDYADHQLEIQGSVGGGDYGTIIFWLPSAYMPEDELRLAASDDLGNFTVLTVRADGSVWRGIP